MLSGDLMSALLPGVKVSTIVSVRTIDVATAATLYSQEPSDSMLATICHTHTFARIDIDMCYSSAAFSVPHG